MPSRSLVWPVTGCRLPSAAFRSPRVSSTPARQALQELLERLARRLVDRAQDLVELDRRLTCAWSSSRRRAARPRLVAGRQLDVGLAEQRLQPQDRAGVARDRRVLRLDLHRHARPVAVQARLPHAADAHAGDPHVGGVGELRRLVEVGLQRYCLARERRSGRRTSSRGRAGSRSREREQDHHRQLGPLGARACSPRALLRRAPWGTGRRRSGPGASAACARADRGVQQRRERRVRAAAPRRRSSSRPPPARARSRRARPRSTGSSSRCGRTRRARTGSPPPGRAGCSPAR